MSNRPVLYFVFVFITVVVSGSGGALISWRLIEQSSVNTDFRQLVLKTHILFSVVFVFFLGSMVTAHVIPHVKNKVQKARKSGLWLLTPTMIMVISGFMLQVISSIYFLEVNYWIHVVSGTIYFLAFVLHRFSGSPLPATVIHASWILVLFLSIIPLLAPEKTQVSEDEFFLGLEENIENQFSATTLLMGSELQMNFYAANAYELHEKALDALKEFNREISVYEQDSKISRLNENQVQSIALSKEALEMWHVAQDVKHGSLGVFDPEQTLRRQNVASSSKAMKSCYTLKYENLDKHCELSVLDWGGIGKGSALEIARSLLDYQKATCIEINFGGQLLYDYLSSRCSVRDQFSFRDIKGVVKTSKKSGSISTSGNYGASVRGENVHIRNPLHGGFVDASYAVVVYHQKADYADAWSTALFAMGPTDGLEIAAKKGLDVLFIFEDGSVQKQGNVLDFMPSL